MAQFRNDEFLAQMPRFLHQTHLHQRTKRSDLKHSMSEGVRPEYRMGLRTRPWMTSHRDVPVECGSRYLQSFANVVETNRFVAEQLARQDDLGMVAIHWWATAFASTCSCCSKASFGSLLNQTTSVSPRRSTPLQPAKPGRSSRMPEILSQNKRCVSTPCANRAST